jgi:hypothetical protein
LVVCDQFAGEVSTIEKLLSGFVATIFVRDFATVFFFAAAGFLAVAAFLADWLFLAVGLFMASAEVTLRFVEAIDFVLLTAFTGAFAGILFVLTFVFRIVFFRKGLDTTSRYPPEPVDANRL